MVKFLGFIYYAAKAAIATSNQGLKPQAKGKNPPLLLVNSVYFLHSDQYY
jgi:hypothetical protein